MVEESSPFTLAKDIAAYVARFVSNTDIYSLPREEQELVRQLKNQAADIKLEIRDWGMAETRNEQQRLAKEVTKRLESMQATIVQAGSHNLLGAVDVAQLSAQLQQLIAVL